MGNIQARRPVRRLSGCLLGIGVITGVWAGFAALLSMSLPEDNGPTAFTFDNAPCHREDDPPAARDYTRQQ